MQTSVSVHKQKRTILVSCREKNAVTHHQLAKEQWRRNSGEDTVAKEQLAKDSGEGAVTKEQLAKEQ